MCCLQCPAGYSCLGGTAAAIGELARFRWIVILKGLVVVTQHVRACPAATALRGIQRRQRASPVLLARTARVAPRSHYLAPPRRASTAPRARSTRRASTAGRGFRAQETAQMRSRARVCPGFSARQHLPALSVRARCDTQRRNKIQISIQTTHRIFDVCSCCQNLHCNLLLTLF
jgi:hypothetical protein